MHVLFATAEIAPFCPDTEVSRICARWAGALNVYKPPRTRDGEYPRSPVRDVSVIMPLHSFIDRDGEALARRLRGLTVTFEGQVHTVTIFEGRTPERVRVFFVEHALFDRAHVFGAPGEEPYGDNAHRYAFFSRCVVEFCRTYPLDVDIIHCHDWPTALVPVYLNTAYAEDEALSPVLTCLSLYDLAQQGVFGPEHFQGMELPEDLLAPDALEHEGKLNLTRGGILFADGVVTASPSYTDAVMAEPAACGLSDVLDYRGYDVFGLLRGVDYEQWDPASDPHIAVRYNVEHLNGKRRNKSELQHVFGLPLRPLVPVVGMIGELTEANGVAEFVATVEPLLSTDGALQVIVVGDGDDASKGALVALAERHPRTVGLHFGPRDEKLEHNLLAGLDMLVVPRPAHAFDARTITAMGYATIAVAPRFGSFADTVEEWSAGKGADKDKGAGFLFDLDANGGLASALWRALDTYRNPRHWRPLQETCMKVDYSWEQSAGTTIALYEELLGEA